MNRSYHLEVYLSVIQSFHHLIKVKQFDNDEHKYLSS